MEVERRYCKGECGRILRGDNLQGLCFRCERLVRPEKPKCVGCGCVLKRYRRKGKDGTYCRACIHTTNKHEDLCRCKRCEIVIFFHPMTARLAGIPFDVGQNWTRDGVHCVGCAGGDLAWSLRRPGVVGGSPMGVTAKYSPM